jgi:hypothetical protein
MPKYIKKAIKGKRGRKPKYLKEADERRIIVKEEDSKNDYQRNNRNSTEVFQQRSSSINPVNLGKDNSGRDDQDTNSMPALADKFSESFQFLILGSMQNLENELSAVKNNMKSCMRNFEKSISFAFKAWATTLSSKKPRKVNVDKHQISEASNDEDEDEKDMKGDDDEEEYKPTRRLYLNRDQSEEPLKNQIQSGRLRRIRKYAKSPEKSKLESNEESLNNMIQPMADASLESKEPVKVFKKRGRKPKDYYLMLKMKAQEPEVGSNSPGNEHNAYIQAFQNTKLVFNSQVRNTLQSNITQPLSYTTSQQQALNFEKIPQKEGKTSNFSKRSLSGKKDQLISLEEIHNKGQEKESRSISKNDANNDKSINSTTSKANNEKNGTFQSIADPVFAGKSFRKQYDYDISAFSFI